MLKFFKKKKKNTDSLVADQAQHKTHHFHSLVVSDIKKETEDCVSVAFDIPSSLTEEFKFLPGQTLTLRSTINGEDVRRSYSLCSSPYDGEVRVAIKQVEKGVFSTYANQTLKVGDTLDVMTPSGSFTTPMDENHEEVYVGIVAGSGITPVMSIMKSVMQAEPKSKFVLIYGNRNANSVIFKEEIEDLKNTYMGRLEVHHVLSGEDQGSDLTYGRIDGTKVKAFAEKFFDAKAVKAHFLCGPAEMIENAKEALESLGVDKHEIHFELFTPVTKPAVTETKKSKSESKVKSNVTVILDGDETHFDIASNGKNVLDAALDAGADVPFACKGAVCCTCRAKVMEGTAKMDMNYALTDEEVEEGYVLTCQTHPTSEKLVVSYDE